ncbi:MAG TPA: hypothetical protein VI542_03630 [Candidatus Tectomicrobia bacterium]
MLHTHLRTVGLALVLLGLAPMVVFAQPTSDGPGSRGVVATITAIDVKTEMATLQTETGEVFTLPKESQWHVGHKAICDRIDAARPWLQHCRIWESAHEPGDAATRRKQSPSSK